MRVRGSLSLLVVALLLVAGCGGKNESPGPSGTASTPPSPASTKAVFPSAGPSSLATGTGTGTGTARVAASASHATPGSASGPNSVPVPKPVTTLPPGTIADNWYSVLNDGQHSGWLHVVWTESTYHDQKTIHDHTERYSVSTRVMGPMTDRFVQRSRIDLERAVGGGLLYLCEVDSVGGQVTVTEERFTGSAYEIRQTIKGHVETHRVAVDHPLPTDSEAYLFRPIRDGKLAAGAVFRFASPNFLAGKLDTVVVAVEGQEVLALATGSTICWRVKETVEGHKGETLFWIDRDGVFRKTRTPGEEIVSTTRERAKALPGSGYRYSITVSAEPDLPRCTTFTKCVVDVILAPEKGDGPLEFPKTAFSREIERKGNRIRLELTAHDDPKADVELPVTDPAVSKWRKPTNLLDSDDPSVVAAARGAIGGAKRGREAARKLLAFVFGSLEKESGPAPSPNASEILKEGRGDCSEHAVLFVSLCRAVGLPARLVSGYAQVGGVWGSHSFTEIWLGRWVGADPTTNELGTRARYISFGRPGDPNSWEGLIAARMRARVQIRTVSFTDRGKSVEVAKLPPRNDRYDPASDLRFAKPPNGYRTKIFSTGMGGIEGPDFHCQVRVISGMGDLPAPLLLGSVLRGGETVKFAGRESVRIGSLTSGGMMMIFVPYRRRLLQLRIQVDDPSHLPASLSALEKILAPTF